MGTIRLCVLVSMLMCAVDSVTANLQCDTSEIPTRCMASSDEDLQLLPTNETELELALTSSNTVRLINGVFPALTLLTKLSIDLRYINNVEAGCFRHLTQLQSLKLINSDPYRPHHNKVLHTGSMEGLAHLSWLEAQDTGLHIIQNNVLDTAVSLVYLDWSNNHIESLPSSLFQNTSQLTMLNLNGNRISSIGSGLLGRLSNLLSVDLSHNSISAVSSWTFLDARKLTELDLSYNQISSLSDDCFAGLDSLVSLKLGHNLLAYLAPSMFAGLEQLESLDLSNNAITLIADGTLGILDSVQYLQLYNNQLTMITSGMFTGMKSLVYLDAYSNNIMVVEALAFRDAVDLTGLHLHSNNLSQIQPMAFANLHNLNVLTLHENALQQLADGVFSDLDSVNHLDLSLNPWDCVCNVTWLHVWLENKLETNVFQVGSWDKTKCASPPQHADKIFTVYLSENYNNCNPTTPEPTSNEIPTGEGTTTNWQNQDVTTGSTSRPMPLQYTMTEATTTTTVSQYARTSEAIATMTLQDNTTESNTNNMYLDQRNSLSGAVKGGIIAACILVAIFLVTVTVLGIYCRHKKHAFWRPERMPQARDAHQSAAVKREKIRIQARHKHDSFYQDPETGDIEKLCIEPKERKWLRDSIQDREVRMESPSLRSVAVDFSGEDSNANKLHQAPSRSSSDSANTGQNIVATNVDETLKPGRERSEPSLGSSRQSPASSTHSVFESDNVSMRNDRKILVPNTGNVLAEKTGLENLAFQSGIEKEGSMAAESRKPSSESHTDSMELSELTNLVTPPIDSPGCQVEPSEFMPGMMASPDMPQMASPEYTQEVGSADYTPEVDTSDIMAEMDSVMRRHSSTFDSGQNPAESYSTCATDSHRTSEMSEPDRTMCGYSSSSTDDFPTTEDPALAWSVSHVDV